MSTSSLTTYEKAVKYYPALWSKARLKKLVSVGRLTEDEYKEITGEEYSST